MAPGVEVHGLAQLRRALRDLPDELADLKDAHAAAAAIVAPAAAARAPRRTGALAASVRGNRAAGKATILAGNARVPYAGPIHWGWEARHIRAQPFAADAAEATRPIWLPAYQAAIDKALEAVERATP